MRVYRNGMLLLSLLSLTACSCTPPIVRTVTVTKTEYVLAPTSLMSKCITPPYSGEKNPQLYQYAFELIAALERCNLNWDALLNWRKGVETDDFN